MPRPTLLVACCCLLAAAGCLSPHASHAERGAALGGLGGAAAGALIGSQSGNALPGAIIGGGVGLLAGSAIGSGMDEVEARNRAYIESRLGRTMAVGGTNVEEIIAMTRAGLAEDVITLHISKNGMARPVTTDDLIRMQHEGVAPGVIRAAQTHSVAAAQVGPPPSTVVVEQPYYVVPAPPPYYPYGYYYPYRPCRPAVGFGFHYHKHRW
jgi:hypothetical protein